MHHNACLSQNPSCGGFVVAEDAELEGIYLHYLTEEFKWIRTGKAVGSDESEKVIVKRNEDGHRKTAAPASLLDSECFYILYPSRSNVNQLPNQMGHFEDLQLYSGFCFSRKGNVDNMVSIVEGDGFFGLISLHQMLREN